MTLAAWDGARVEELRARWGVPHLEVHASIGSTNDRAAELARAGAAPFSVVVADEQTAGRGRRGGRWSSPAGAGLLMSVVLPASGVAHLPLLVGLAVAESIEAATGAGGVAIKWPNDLLCAGGKVAGILCEGSGERAVAGIGVNVRAPAEALPPELEGRAISLDVATGKKLARSDLAGLIVRRVEGLLRDPLPALAPAALAGITRRDALLGRPLVTDAAGAGEGAGIAPDGALLLRRPDGSVVRVVSGGVASR